MLVMSRNAPSQCPSCKEGIAEKARSYCRRCASERMKKHYHRIRAEVIAMYGGSCVCCGESALDFLVLDHINDDGKSHRELVGRGYAMYMWVKKNDCPSTLQVLCANCNTAKQSGKGICRPHGKTLTTLKRAFFPITVFALY